MFDCISHGFLDIITLCLLYVRVIGLLYQITFYQPAHGFLNFGYVIVILILMLPVVSDLSQRFATKATGSQSSQSPQLSIQYLLYYSDFLLYYLQNYNGASSSGFYIFIINWSSGVHTGEKPHILHSQPPFWFVC